MKAVYALDAWRGRPGAEWERAAVLEPVEAGPTVVMVWAREVPDTAALFAGAPARRWIVHEHVQWDDLAGPPALTRLVFVRRLAALSRDEFASHWSQRHTPLARVHHPGMARYVQHVVLDGDDESDGIAELGFATRDDLEHRFYDSDEGRRVIGDDVARFLDVSQGWRVLTTETRFGSG